MNPITRRSLAVTAAVIIAIGVAWGLEIFLSASPQLPYAHTPAGHHLGWLGFAVLLWTAVYPYKKHHSAHATWPKTWFYVHLAAGIVGPLLILVHAGWHLHAGVPVLALLAMAVVTLSGITGQAIHSWALRALREQRRELAQHGLSRETIDRQIETLAAQAETFRVWQIIHAPLAVIFAALALTHIVGALYFGGT